MTTPLHCKVCAKSLHGQQRLYCGRPCKRRAYAAKQKLREAQELADVVDAHRASVCVDDVSCVNVTQTGDCITVMVPPGTTASTVTAAVEAHRNTPKPPQVWTSTTLTEALKAGSTQEKMELLKEAGILTAPTPKQPSLPRRLYAYIQLLGHTLYHVFDGWRTK